MFWAVIVPSVHFLTFFHSEIFLYADMLMTTLMAVVPSPGVRVTVAESLVRDLGRVSEWCDIW